MFTSGISILRKRSLRLTFFVSFRLHNQQKLYQILLGFSISSYDLCHLRIESDTLRNRINYTILQYDPNRRNIRITITEVIRYDAHREDYAKNQPFNMACRNVNKIRSQFLESATRNIFKRKLNGIESNVFV